jgi:predicted AlkP superfamily phosphohydrolase/phosphomutase
LTGKVVVVGLDGATLDVMGPMMSDGRLKNFSELAHRGTMGRLTSTILPLSATAWNTFATGSNPGKHGIYDFSRRVPGTYNYVPVSSVDREGRTMWDYASQKGKKCLIVNVPLTYPPERVNGIMVSGFPYPEGRGDYAIPGEVLQDIQKATGVTHLHKPSPHFLKPGDERKLIDELLRISADQAKVVKYLLRKDAWDFVTTVFDATDVISHFFWRYIDPKNPTYDRAKAAEFGPLFYDVYDAVDAAFGEIASELAPDDSVFVISDHGFGPVYYAVYMNNWLLENNYLKLRKSMGTRIRKGFFRVGITTDFLFRTAKRLGLVSSRTYTYGKKSRSLQLARALSLSLDDIDWDRTLVYSYGNYGQFFLNIKGREPRGALEPGAQSEQLTNELKQKLRELKDPKTGRILFDIIYTKDEVYHGPRTGAAADLVFFDSTMTYRAHRLFEFGSRNMIAPDPIYSGSHRMDGVLIGAGPQIMNSSTLDGAGLIDIPPTILHMMGLPIPSSMDGRVLGSLFVQGSPLAKEAPTYLKEEAGEGLAEAAKGVARSGRRL